MLVAMMIGMEDSSKSDTPELRELGRFFLHGEGRRLG